MTSNESFRTDILAQAELVILDAEKDEGIDVARRHQIRSFPTFILTDAEGAVYDRWLGYGNVESFLTDLGAATDDPMTLTARADRFAETPTAADAAKIGDLRRYEGMVGEAIAWYDRARELDPEVDLAMPAFEARVAGYRSRLYDLASLSESGRRVVDSGTASDVGRIASTFDRLTRDAEDRSAYHDILRQSVKRLEAMDGEDATQTHARVMVEVALHLDEDPEAAFRWRKASMPEGWQESADALNNVAWWCFENEVALDEAEGYARKAVGLAEAGTPRGNVLDTLAEICNLKGDCGEAVALMRQAVAEHPDSEYFQKQLARFEELLAAQEQDG